MYFIYVFPFSKAFEFSCKVFCVLVTLTIDSINFPSRFKALIAGPPSNGSSKFFTAYRSCCEEIFPVSNVAYNMNLLDLVHIIVYFSPIQLGNLFKEPVRITATSAPVSNRKLMILLQTLVVTFIFACHSNPSTPLTELTFSSIIEPRKMPSLSPLTSDLFLQTLAKYPIFEHSL